MKNRTLLCLLMTAALGGCVIAAPAHLYPVQGPLAAKQPVPVYTMSVTFLSVQSSVSAILKDGEVCRGTLQTVVPDDPAGHNMQDDWDRIYGQGFFVSSILGKQRTRTTLVGGRGTQLHVELYNPGVHTGGVRGVIGVARDDQGNLYKISF